MAMHCGGAAVPGGTLVCYRVGDIREDDGNYSFGLTEELSGNPVETDSLTDPEFAAYLEECIGKKNISGITEEIDGNGSCTFADLMPGLYLIVQKEAASGYNKAASFLVSLPMYEDGAYIYDVEAGPKVEITKKPSTPSTSSITTHTGSRLPQTGQLNWPVPVLCISGLVLISIGSLLRMSARKPEYEA